MADRRIPGVKFYNVHHECEAEQAAEIIHPHANAFSTLAFLNLERMHGRRNVGQLACDKSRPAGGRQASRQIHHAMPKMTGTELALELRALHAHIPIILATGYAERTPGFSDELPRLAKPFCQAELRAAIQSATSAKTQH
jgi:CheY-like chemotaxis protein